MTKKKDAQLRKDISKSLLKLNSEIQLSWLTRLNHQELLGLWIALIENQDEDDLIRF